MTANKGSADQASIWVGIGASAGGLEALRIFVKHLQVGSDAVYIIAQHMSPQHKSLLTALIGRETDLEVYEITDKLRPRPNTIYVAPPNHDITVKNGRLLLHDPSPEPGAPKPSVDRFFRSLAETMASRSVGVILSGTGSDGTRGIEAIRAAGGVTIAQSMETSKYFGMPESAIKSGFVDMVLGPEEIGDHLERIVSMPRQLARIAIEGNPEDSYAVVMRALHGFSKVDFREYKASTVRRRIERRIAAHGLKNLEAYAEHIKADPTEAVALFKDMMISVTSFFRDNEEFEELKQQLATLVEDRGQAGLRIWIPGCATGEEAYSIAILVAELKRGPEDLDRSKLQIFATDIDEDALTNARRGYFPETSMENVPEDLRARYFTRTGGGYLISSVIRDCVVFTAHNICQDPPFSNMDLVSCRNLLIYFNTELQNRVMARLHYSLNMNGILFLGKSETISGADELFRPLTTNGRLFKRRMRLDKRQENMSALISSGVRKARPATLEDDQTGYERMRAMFDALVRSVGANCLLVSADFQIRRVYGNIDRYITLSEGDVRGVNLSMLRDEYRHEVRMLITTALRVGETRLGAERRIPDQDNTVLQIAVHPLNLIQGSDDMAVVAFRVTKSEPLPLLEDADPDAERTHAQLVVLERELNTTRDSLQQTVEELETTNEELQALNEELQSSNEELQSTNEELETANEELQSTNEELITVNEELQINSQELSMINQELDSILANIAAPILVIDSGLHIVRCSESARDLFMIDPGVSRPHLSQCASPREFPEMTPMIAEVIRFGKRAEMPFETDRFRGRITAAPYFSSKGELIGATAIISDMPAEETQALETILLDHVTSMIWQKGSDGRLTRVNRAALDLMGVTRTEAIGAELGKFLPGLVQNATADRAIMERKEAKLGLHEKITLAGNRTMWLEVSRIPCQLVDDTPGMFIVASDISGNYEQRIGRGKEKALAEIVLDAAPVGIEYIDTEGRVRMRNETAQRLSGSIATGAEWQASPQDAMFIDPVTRGPLDPSQHPVRRVLRGEVPSQEMTLRVSDDGTEKPQWIAARAVHDETGALMGAVGALITFPDQQPPDGGLPGDDGETTDATRLVLDWAVASDDVTLSPDLIALLETHELRKPRTMKGLRRLVHRDDRDALNAAIETHLTRNAPLDLWLRLGSSLDTALSLHCRGETLTDKDGNATSIVLTFLKTAEAKTVQRTTDRQAALVAMADELEVLPTWRLDIATNKVELSEAAGTVLGLSNNRSIVDLEAMLEAFTSDDQHVLRHGMHSVANEAVPFTAKVTGANGAGPVGMVISGCAERDPKGSIIGVLGLVHAIEAHGSDQSTAAG